ncbi:MAG: hypothetical protein V1767_01040 [Chloroflexota bacterium]
MPYKAIADCVTEVERLLDTLLEITHAQRQIDEMLMSDYRHLPDACIPELFRESEEPASGTCELTSEQVKPMFRKQREWAKARLSQLYDELKLSSVNYDLTFKEYNEIDRVANLIKEEAESIDVDEDSGLVALTGVNMLVSSAMFQMFEEFNDCMKRE